MSQQPTYTCMVCGQKMYHAYARWAAGDVCNRTCNERHVAELKLNIERAKLTRPHDNS